MYKYADEFIALFIIALLFVLIITGIDGEVKSLFAASIGLIMKAIYDRLRGRRK